MTTPLDWRTVGLLCCTRTGVRSETQQCIRALVNRGARDLVLDGLTDVALARNCALTAAAELTRQHRELAAWLLVDDDMAWQVEAAEDLLIAAIVSGRPTSGVYMTNAGYPAVTPKGQGIPNLTGLGFFALPARRLLELEQASQWAERGHGQKFRVFTQCGLNAQGVWRSEDYHLCERLGDVDVAPVWAVHLRTVPLTPSQETVDQVSALARQKEE